MRRGELKRTKVRKGGGPMYFPQRVKEDTTARGKIQMGPRKDAPSFFFSRGGGPFTCGKGAYLRSSWEAKKSTNRDKKAFNEKEEKRRDLLRNQIENRSPAFFLGVLSYRWRKGKQEGNLMETLTLLAGKEERDRRPFPQRRTFFSTVRKEERRESGAPPPQEGKRK